MLKIPMASRLLHSDVKVREQIYSRIKHMMEEVDMAFYDRSSGIGFVYSNLGDLIKKVQSRNANGHELLNRSLRMKAPTVQKDGLVELRANMERLQDVHGRLQFVIQEIEEVLSRKVLK